MLYRFARSFVAGLFLLGFGSSGIAGEHAGEHKAAATSPDKVLSDIKEGNQHFWKAKMRHPNQTPERIKSLMAGQHPGTIVLSCSDSRIPPEIVMDQGLGDIFVVRTAGQTVDDMAIASIEYAVEHVGANLLVVLGHESCGAIKATLTTKEGASAGSPSLDKLVAQIRGRLGKDLGEKTIEKDPLMVAPASKNASAAAEELVKTSKIIREKVEANQLKIVKAIYRIGSGSISFWEN